MVSPDGGSVAGGSTGGFSAAGLAEISCADLGEVGREEFVSLVSSTGSVKSISTGLGAF